MYYGMLHCDIRSSSHSAGEEENDLNEQTLTPDQFLFLLPVFYDFN